MVVLNTGKKRLQSKRKEKGTQGVTLLNTRLGVYGSGTKLEKSGLGVTPLHSGGKAG